MEKLIKFGKYAMSLVSLLIIVLAFVAGCGGPSEPKSYVDVTAYEIISEMTDGIQPPKKNEKLTNYLNKNKGLRINGYVSAVNIDGDTAVVSIVPFMQYSLADDKQVRMSERFIAIEAANKDVNSVMKNLRRGDFVYIDSTFLGFDDKDSTVIHFAGFHVDRQKAGIK